MAKIAISYRRSDSQDITGRIFDRLVQHYGKDTVFRDIDSIQPGIDFRTQIAAALRTTDVLLVIAGPAWLGHGPGAETRMDNEADPVRIEVETALKRDIPIIPVLVGGMKMPEVGELSPSLRDFAYRHAVTVDGGRDFDHHIDGLIRALDRIVAPPPVSAVATTAGTHAVQPPPRSSALRMYGILGGLAALAIVLAAFLFRSETKPVAASLQTPIQSAGTPSVTPVVAANPAPSADIEAQQAWAATKDSTSVAVLTDFIRQFGDTPYGSMARARLAEVEKSQAGLPITVPPSPPLRLADLPSAATPAFECSKSHAPDEQTICHNGQLAYLDQQLNVVFEALRNRLGKEEQAVLGSQEQAWLKQRAACGTDVTCIATAYQTRLAQLQNWH